MMLDMVRLEVSAKLNRQPGRVGCAHLFIDAFAMVGIAHPTIWQRRAATLSHAKTHE